MGRVTPSSVFKGRLPLMEVQEKVTPGQVPRTESLWHNGAIWQY